MRSASLARTPCPPPPPKTAWPRSAAPSRRAGTAHPARTVPPQTPRFFFQSELRTKWRCEELGDRAEPSQGHAGRRLLRGGPLGGAHAFRLLWRPSFVTATMSQWLRINYRRLDNENNPLPRQHPAGEYRGGGRGGRGRIRPETRVCPGWEEKPGTEGPGPTADLGDGGRWGRRLAGAGRDPGRAGWLGLRGARRGGARLLFVDGEIA